MPPIRSVAVFFGLRRHIDAVLTIEPFVMRIMGSGIGGKTIDYYSKDTSRR